MKIFLMFGQREERYEGEHGPEAVDFVWDEFCVEANPEGFEAAKQEAELKAKKDGFIRTKLFAVEVDGDRVARLLNGVPTLKGTVTDDA